MTAAAPIDWSEKVQKLLTLAENASTPEEAETFTKKAVALMQTHSIDEAMLNAGREVPDEIIIKTVPATGIFARNKRALTDAIARVFDVRIVHDEYKRMKPKQLVTILHGYKSDIDQILVLNASLQLQAETAHDVWKKSKSDDWNGLPGFEKFKDRREFRDSFAMGVHNTLQRARTQATADAVAARTSSDVSAAEAKTGVELVLRDRADTVSDWTDKHYGAGGLVAGRRSSVRSGSQSAASAGYAAGRDADTGSGRKLNTGGGRRAIGSGA